MLLLTQLSLWELLSITLVFSLLVGSFLNVVIYRLPKSLKAGWRHECQVFLEPEQEFPEPEKFNLVTPNSHCPHCQHEIKPWQNIPIISYLLLRGRCSHCHTRISARYPLIEACTALLSVVVAWQLGASEEMLAALLLTWVLIALTMIDFDTQLLPDQITLPFLWLGIIASFSLDFATLQDSVIGAMAGYLSLWSVYWLFKLLTGKEGMGYGDFKLLAMLGAWLGWQSLPLILILSTVVGAIVGISLIIFKRHQRDTAIPFGPYLCGGGWIALLWGDQLIQHYLLFLNIS